MPIHEYAEYIYIYIYIRTCAIATLEHKSGTQLYHHETSNFEGVKDQSLNQSRTEELSGKTASFLRSPLWKTSKCCLGGGL